MSSAFTRPAPDPAAGAQAGEGRSQSEPRLTPSSLQQCSCRQAALAWFWLLCSREQQVRAPAVAVPGVLPQCPLCPAEGEGSSQNTETPPRAVKQVASSHSEDGQRPERGQASTLLPLAWGMMNWHPREGGEMQVRNKDNGHIACMHVAVTGRESPRQRARMHMHAWAGEQGRPG